MGSLKVVLNVREVVENHHKDYSNRFADSLVDDFNTDVEVRDVVKKI